MRRSIYLLSVLALLLLTVVIVMVLLRTRPETVVEPVPGLPLAVRTATVERGQLRTTVTENGRLVPVEEAKVLFQVEGAVTNRPVVPGQRVAMGEVLLDVEDSRQRAAVQRAEARLEMALLAEKRDTELLRLSRERVVLLQQEVQRQQALQQDAISSLERLQQAERELIVARIEQQRLQYEVDVAAQNQEQLRADLATARRQLAYCHITAPFAAVVNAVPAQVGDNVTPGQLAVHLVSADELEVLLAVSGGDLPGLEPGGRATVIPGDNLPPRAAVVQELQLVPDERTYTHSILLRLEDSTGLLAGQVVTVSLPGRTLDDVLLVPSSALWQEEGIYYLYTVGEDNRLRRVQARVLASTNSMAAVDGVTYGQEVVLESARTMLPGQIIQRKNSKP